MKTQIVGNSQKIQVLKINNKEYISLSALGRYSDFEEPKVLVYTWMSKKDIMSYINKTERFNNNKNNV